MSRLMLYYTTILYFVNTASMIFAWSRLNIVKLRSRSRSGQGQVRVRKVRVRSKSGKVQLRTQNQKIWTWAILYFLFVHIAASSLHIAASCQLPHKLLSLNIPAPFTQPPAPIWTLSLKHTSSLHSFTPPTALTWPLSLRLTRSLQRATSS